MPASTAELARRFRETLPPWQQKMLSVVAMPGSGRKAHQLNWALRPETLGVTLGEGYDPRRVYVGVSDADSLPDRNVYRWMAAEVLAGRGAPAYQGVTLSLANFVAQDGRGRVCAIQQSSIFIRVSIARLINEARRVQWFARVTARAHTVWARRARSPSRRGCSCDDAQGRLRCSAMKGSARPRHSRARVAQWFGVRGVGDGLTAKSTAFSFVS